MLNAAKTVPGITPGMPDEEILSKITVYCRDAQGKWINAKTGETITPTENFNIRYVDGQEVTRPVEPETPPTEVATADELKQAIADTGVNNIKLTQNMSLTEPVTIDGRQLTIDIGETELDLSGITGEKAIEIKNGSRLTIRGNKGNIKGAANNTFYNAGNLNLSEVNLTVTKVAIHIEGRATPDDDVIPFTSINGCKIKNTDSTSKAITVNGVANTDIYGSTITAKNAIYVSTNVNGTRTNINSSTIESTDIRSNFIRC